MPQQQLSHPGMVLQSRRVLWSSQMSQKRLLVVELQICVVLQDKYRCTLRSSIGLTVAAAVRADNQLNICIAYYSYILNHNHYAINKSLQLRWLQCMTVVRPSNVVAWALTARRENCTAKREARLFVLSCVRPEQQVAQL